MTVVHAPVTRWLPRYKRAFLGPDLVAGLTVWALVVPESMAYASIAGVPVEYGLYSVPFAILGYVVFGTSRRLVMGPTSTVAAMTAAAVAPVAVGTGSLYIALVAALSLLVGAFFVLFGLLRLGWIAHFFAKPVLDGFIVGLGVFIAVGQLHKLVGTPKGHGNTVQQFWQVLSHAGDWSWTTVAVGAASLAVLFGMARLWPRVPGALVVLVAGIAAVTAFDLGAHGVALVGEVPTGYHFVPWSTVSLHDLVDLVPGALGIVVVAFAQSLAIAKSYARKDGEEVDANAELVAYGASSIGAGLLQGFPPAGSLSKTAAAAEAGEKTPVALLFTVVLVVATTLVLAGVFENLPEAVLGAVVIHAVWGMIDPAPLTRLRKARLPDFWLALAALAGVVLVGILAGIVVGVVLSLVMLIHRLDHPYVASLGRRPDRSYSDLAADPDAVAVPGALVFRVDAPLIFANAEVILATMTARLDEAGAGVTAVVLDFESVYEIDTEGADILVQLAEELRRRHLRVAVARAHAAVRGYLERTGALAAIGPGNLYATVDEAVRATA
ncbi:MAG TPA: SulP family inorganic anion transporter [Acidimicrobiales bacterium]|nr:SulP family inorganic anion transporter [Acidimicrobiales bacterium]